MAKNTRTVNIAVVGLSGTEKEKGTSGVGKSCLCNRFIRQNADDFYEVHTSLISQSDFGGRVVNNDHFLYWGEAQRIDEGCVYTFRVVEQTEFIDDATFQPHRSTNLQPYFKRAAATKLCSAEKLMYICTDQLGIEQDFEQKQMPDGKLNIDGFLLCCDVSLVPSRKLDCQLNFISNLQKQLLKTKKPVLLVATKCDVVVEQFIRDLQHCLSRGKMTIPIIEISAFDNINVELAFVALAQMIDKTRGKPKIIPFAEAARQQKEIVAAAAEKFSELLAEKVLDLNAEWRKEKMTIEANKDFQEYVFLKGEKYAKDLFRKHIKHLRDEFVFRKKREYKKSFSKACEVLIPDLDEVEGLSREEVQKVLQSRQKFDTYFMVLGRDEQWYQIERIKNGEEQRIPCDFLRDKEAEDVYQEHLRILKALRWKEEMKVRFKKVLAECNQVSPGKMMEEVNVFLLGDESYQHLTEAERLEIYTTHEREIFEKAKDEFQEMLLEHSDLFVDLDLNATPSKEKMGEINRELNDDLRFQALRRLPGESHTLLLRHIGFIYHPTIQTCFSGKNCMDIQIKNQLSCRSAEEALRPKLMVGNSSQIDKINIVLLGRDGLADELAKEILAQSSDNEYTLDGRIYELDLKAIDDDMLPAKFFRGTDFKPHGCFCVYNSPDSLNYIEHSLQKHSEWLHGGKKEKSLLPVILIMGPSEKKIKNVVMASLRIQGKQFASKLQYHFVDLPLEECPSQSRFHEHQIKQALQQLLEARKRRPAVVSPSAILKEPTEADLCIQMCVMCGDSFSGSQILAPFVESQFCSITKREECYCAALDVFLGAHRRRVEVSVLSYHSAMLQRDQGVHGYVLVYFAKRRASLAMLRAFLGNVPDVIPVHFLAMTNTDNDLFNCPVTKELVTEGEQIATDIGAKFKMTSRLDKQPEIFTFFFQEVFEQKSLINESIALWERSKSDPLLASDLFGSLSSSTSGLLEEMTGSMPALALSNNGRLQCPSLESPFINEFESFFSPQDTTTQSRPGLYGTSRLCPTTLALEFEDRPQHRRLPLSPSNDHDSMPYAEPMDVIVSKKHQEETIYSDPVDSRTGRIVKIKARSFDDSIGNGVDPTATENRLQQVRIPQLYKLRSERLRPRRTAIHGMVTISPDTTHRPRKESEDTEDKTKKSKWDRSLRSKKKSMKKQEKKESNYFGHPLNELVQSEQPIPLFVEKCVHYIEAKGLSQEGLYRVCGNKAEQDALQRKFDADHSISFEALEANVNVVAGLLKAFFSELPEPLLPYDIHPELVEAIGCPDRTSKLVALQKKIKKTSSINQEVFKYIITHLHKVTQHSTLNRMTSENLSICFAPTLMRPDYSICILTATKNSNIIIEMCIRQCPYIFYNQPEVADSANSPPSSPTSMSLVPLPYSPTSICYPTLTEPPCD
uniref:rho GTPase-activating protein 5-like n=1 Tax=Myxine glutinosa TaxID=7769 RepID=UPI00359027CB